ncbi:MAG: phosphatidylserine decarboxylase [Candidatus Zhuqueibacterota bacterium]
MTVYLFGMSISTAALLVIPLGLVWQFTGRHIRRLLLAETLITAALLLSIHPGGSGTGRLELALIALCSNGLLTALILAVMFFRDPERDIPSVSGAILSPADGRVVYVKRIIGGEIPIAVKKDCSMKLTEFADAEFLTEGGYLVGIGMSVMNVHVNRAPIAGVIALIRRRPGKFLSLKTDEALRENERVTTIIDNGDMRVGVIQIASRLVRRIVSYLPEGSDVAAGARIGRIRFGSQVDVVIPQREGLKVNVTPGQEVQAGASILAMAEMKAHVERKSEKMVAEACCRT